MLKKRSFIPLLLAALFAVASLGSALVWGPAAAQVDDQPVRFADPPPQIILAQEDPSDTLVHIPAPPDLLVAESSTALITVRYMNAWPPQAQAAFEYARQIWEQQLTATVPIVVDAYWDSLSAGYLGWAGPIDLWAADTFPQKHTWYPAALANQLAGQDLNGAEAEIKATLNSNFGAWYFGTDGRPPDGKYDFVSVVLHELAHGLAYSGTMQVSNGVGWWGFNWSTVYPSVYDRFAENLSGQSLVNGFPNNSSALAAQLQSNAVFFNGSAARAANGGERPKLYAPGAWKQGSSFVHLDESTYQPASGNSLMTPIFSDGEAIHNPGALMRGMLQDLGWKLPGPVVIVGKPVGFLPAVTRNLPCIDPCLFGQVTEQARPAAWVKIDLLRFNGSAWVQQATTNTDSRGYYAFKNVPALPTGQVYAAQYLNPAPQQTGRLFSWNTAINPGYSAAPGDSRWLGDFDISDVLLASPVSGASLSFPAVFKWTPRAGWNNDIYQLVLSASPGSTPLWRSPELGYKDSYTLTALPAGLRRGVTYSWSVWVYNEDGANGRARESRPVTFP